MKKLFGLFLLAAAWLAPVPADAANCFWVGGTGTWNNSNATSWASSSGGSAGTCAGPGNIPGASDTATFDANSGGGTVTINSPNGAGVVTVQSLSVTNFTGTLDNATNNNSVTISGGAGLAGSAGAFTLNFGAATWNISSAGAAIFSIHNGATVSAASSTIHLVNSGTGFNFNTANKTWGTFTVSMTNAAGGQANSQGSGSSYGALILGNTAGNFTFLTGNNTVTSAFTVNGTSSKQIGVVSTSGATLTLTGATATATWAAFHRITASGAAITATDSFGLGGNSNVSITPPSGGGGGGGGRIIGG